jgi:hypothetical protein
LCASFLPHIYYSILSITFAAATDSTLPRNFTVQCAILSNACEIHLVGVPNGRPVLQTIALFPVVVIAEGYATATNDREARKSDGIGRLLKP